MIKIPQNKTADTRTCDVTKVSKQQLLDSSEQHIRDVKLGLGFFSVMLEDAQDKHDFDKITKIDDFYHDFKNNFETTTWWGEHRKLNRHHLLQADGIPENVNLIDVLEFITDCVMAGKARSGEVRDVTLAPKVLMSAFLNTVKLLDKNVKVII